MVELNVVDLVGSSGLESLINEVEFFVSYPQLLAVEDGPEPGVGHKSALALVFVLEERLDQKSSVLHVGSNSHHQLLQLLLLGFRKGVLGVEDRWGVVGAQSHGWVLLKGLVSEDVLNLLIEVKVSDFEGVHGASEMVLQQDVFFSGQLYLLSIQSCSEFGGFDSAFSQRVVVLEELSKSDSVSFNHVSNFLHQL